MKLKRGIGPIGLMFSAVSGILGSAWLFSPYYAAQHAGPSALLAWVFGWFAMLLIAMTFAELVTTFPVAGGNARYIHFTHGPFAGFLFSWIMWLGYAAVAPVETMGVLQYLASELPWLTKVAHGVPVLTPWGYGMAAALLLLMCWVNFFGIKWVARYNNAMVWVKIVMPIVVAVALMMTVFHSHNFSSTAGFMPYGMHSLAMTLSVGGVVFAFAGYAPAIVLAGEAKNPQKTVPLVLIGALTVCLLVYLVVQTAFIGAVQPEALQHGWQHLHYQNDTSPFVGMAELAGLDHLKYIIFLTAVLAPLGTAFIFVTTSSRVAYAMAQNRVFPHIFKRLNGRGVPVASVLLNFVVGMVLFFPAPGWQGMVSFLVSAFVLCYGIGPVALLVCRQSAPGIPRPFKLPWATGWCALAFCIANLIVYWTGWPIVSKMLIAIALGLIVLALMVLKRKREDGGYQVGFKQGAWIVLYLALLGAISYLGQFGGVKWLSSGYDEAAIVVMSLLVLVLAVKSRHTSIDFSHLRGDSVS